MVEFSQLLTMFVILIDMDNATQNWEQMTYPFFNLKLNYNFNALEPFINTKMMQAHYDHLLENYIKNLNQILEQRLELQNLNLKSLIDYAEKNQDINLLRQASGVYNHFFFFTELRPATGQIIIGITPQATTAITKAFGGWKTFKEQFTNAALNIFGSGYAWLVKNIQGELSIITTTNQNIPTGFTPILCLDVWEHAYYLQYTNDRHRYIEAFWSVVDWVKFCERI